MVDKWYWLDMIERDVGDSMSQSVTEEIRDDAIGLDAGPLEDAARLLSSCQVAASGAVMAVQTQLCAGARAMAATLRQGGTLNYAGAGSSGLMAAADAMELGGTYGIPSDQVRILMPGGIPNSAEMPGETEDQLTGLETLAQVIDARDTMIAVSASGATPYTLEAARIASGQGASVLAIANVADAPLFDLADHAIFLATDPEVISGSTRMGAGTAQKIALNILSTLMAIELGHVHDGMMVNLRADNTKLYARARAIVGQVVGAGEAAASDALSAASGDVKHAIILAAGAATLDDARALLDRNGGRVRDALGQLDWTPT